MFLLATAAMDGETNQAVTCNLSHCDKIPDGNNSRESDLGAQFKGMQSTWRARQGSRNGVLGSMHNQEAKGLEERRAVEPQSLRHQLPQVPNLPEQHCQLTKCPNTRGHQI